MTNVTSETVHSIVTSVQLGGLSAGLVLGAFPIDTGMRDTILGELMRPALVVGADGQSAPATITNALVSQSCIRPCGWSPTPENRHSIETTVARYMAQGLPIKCISMAGATKLYGLADQHSADIAELLLLQRFAGLNEAVRRHYPPGLHIRLVMEDEGERILDTGVTDLESRISTYVRGVRSLSQLLGYDFVEVVPESELLAVMHPSAALREQFGLPDGPVDSSTFRLLAHNLSLLFVDYLEECDAREAEGREDCDHSTLGSLRALQGCGFRGTIPKIQRDYYYGRATYCACAPLEKSDARREVARYLGAALARVRLGLGATRITDAAGEIPPLKFSFVQHAPGSPPELQRNRLEYVAARRSKGSSRKTPPWGGAGVLRLCETKLRPCILTVLEWRLVTPLAKGQLVIRNERGCSFELPIPVVSLDELN